MTVEERKKKFEEAKKAREMKLKEESSGGFGSVDVPDFKCAVLKPNKGIIIRLIGNSVEMAEKDTDPIIVEKSMIKGDDDKWFNLIWSKDENHPMNKIRKTILGKYSWDKENKCRIYENKDLAVFKRFMTNGIDGNPYNQGMMPQKFILFNCITRGDDTWCKDNKHTKMLCWDATEKEVDGKMVSYPTYGVKPSFYKILWEEKCCLINRHFEDSDFYVKRLNKDTKIGDSYMMVLTPEEKSAIRNEGEKQGVDFLSFINDDYLSDEEASYEKYVLKNIPFVSMPTPVSVILSKLGKYIKEVDKTFGTNHYEEFVEWKAKEISELKQKNENKEDDSKKEESVSTSSSNGTSFNDMKKVETTSADNEEVVEENNLPTEVEEPKVVTKKVLKKTVSTFELEKFVDMFPTINELSDEEKSMVVGWDDENSVFKFKEGIEMAECPCCAENGIPCPPNQEGNDIPDMFTKCIYCGTSFE